MKLLLKILVMLALGTVPISGQTRADFWGSPREVIEQYWNMGVSGELLTSEGWDRASGFYAKPNSPPPGKFFDVYSNFNGLYSVSINGDKAEVAWQYVNCGRVDSDLRYSPPPKTNALKMALVFRLVLTPSYMRMFGPDGKTEIERKPTGDSAWKIEGPAFPPWTTVNTAVRYVLEMRNKATDPAIKKNADQTLAKLLTLH
jgi:hypothetical protein